jgi:hypothetical protein
MSKNPPGLNQVLYARMRSAARTRSICQNYARYEAEKSIWISLNPKATPDQYTLAVQAIAKACRV